MRQVAVDNKQQRKGVGSMLVTFAEKIASQHRFSRVVLSARTMVLSF
ncbi:GNAT family N-acetyltransferase [Candidatus Woesearchaeota archaeon]|nr:GNAT family N-acetyltransferase [Candidatus Woesearchaeota archaeon]